jgi:uncharacterized protein DUF1592/uncharacterized protein DUF1588/uncharacterized protein DUF1595/uncharacterized protein DUF1585/uncharacterized protein DUF1587
MVRKTPRCSSRAWFATAPAVAALALPLSVFSFACAGRAGGSSGGGGSGSPSGSGGATGSGATQGGGSGGGSSIPQPQSAGLALFTQQVTCGGDVQVGSSPVRRLSRVEYDNIVRDLGLDPGNTQPAKQFVTEQKINGNFNTNAYAGVSGTLINSQYLQAAETLAAAAVSSNNLQNLVSCASQANAACAQQFISSFANRAFRGQLDSTESAALLALYNKVSGQFDFATGIQAVIEAVLTSPRFLFVLEFGQSGSGAAVPLAPLELATRLSLYLWRSIPDQTLIDAANNGHLATAADVQTQATRMLADSKAAGALQDFANQWLDIENMDAVTKDTQFKTWSAALAEEMHMESLVTFSNSVTKDNTDYATLLTQTSSYVNNDLKTFYTSPSSYQLNNGSGPGAATDYQSAALPTPHMGILTDGSVLAIHAHTTLPSPTLRGRMVRQQILCEQVPEPPASVGGKPIPPPPTAIGAGQTTRDLYLMHVANGAATGANGTTTNECNDCHQDMDWIGFGFDDFDATGAYITTEGGVAVDSSGQFIAENTGDLGGTFSGTTDMIQKLSQSSQVNQCFALEQLRYALGRVEVSADACSAQQIYQAFSSANFNLQKLLIAVVSSNSFMYRTPVTAGGACQ